VGSGGRGGGWKKKEKEERVCVSANFFCILFQKNFFIAGEALSVYDVIKRTGGKLSKQ
jgi:hypothetical protein